MGIFARIGNGWSLAMTSLGIIRQNKGLVIFPIVSSIALILVMASFAGGLHKAGVLEFSIEHSSTEEPAAEEPAPGESEPEQLPEAAYYVLLFVFYFINYFIITFFNMGLIHCAMISLGGGEPRVGDGIAFSFSRVHSIFGWALISATVGLILRIIEDRSEKVAAIIAGLLGMAWSLLTFFVVPVVAYEKVGVFAAVKRSSALFTKTWGERVGAAFAFQWISFLLMIPIALPLGVLLGMFVHVAVGIAVGALVVVLIFCVISAAEVVFKAAAYLYAIDGDVGAFDRSRLESAFVAR